MPKFQFVWHLTLETAVLEHAHGHGWDMTMKLLFFALTVQIPLSSIALTINSLWRGLWGLELCDSLPYLSLLCYVAPAIFFSLKSCYCSNNQHFCRHPTINPFTFCCPQNLCKIILTYQRNWPREYVTVRGVEAVTI